MNKNLNFQAGIFLDSRETEARILIVIASIMLLCMLALIIVADKKADQIVTLGNQALGNQECTVTVLKSSKSLMERSGIGDVIKKCENEMLR